MGLLSSLSWITRHTLQWITLSEKLWNHWPEWLLSYISARSAVWVHNWNVDSLLRKRCVASNSQLKRQSLNLHVCSMATHSIESDRSKTYSSSLRWRMVHQRYILGLSYNQTAKNLNVDPSTVYRTVKLFHETGTVCMHYSRIPCKHHQEVEHLQWIGHHQNSFGWPFGVLALNVSS